MKKALLFLVAALTMGFVANAQFSENFNSVADGAIPTGWTVYGDGLANVNNSNANFSNFNDSWQAYNGEMLTISWKQQAVASDRWLVTPQITVPASGNVLLTFDVTGYYDPAQDPEYAEYMKVMVSTTDNQKASFSLLEDLGGMAPDKTTYGINMAQYAGQSVYLAFVNYGDGIYMLMDNVSLTDVPDEDIAIEMTRGGWIAPAGNNETATVVVKNLGFNPLTSYDIVYSINGGANDTINVTGINVSTFATHTHSFTYTLSTAGAANIVISVTNPNGQDDPDMSNNTGSVKSSFYVQGGTTERMTLLEHFTTNQCVWCPLGHERMESAMSNFGDRVAWVAHHVGYGEDVWTIDASRAIQELYGSSMWAPAMALDRNAAFAGSDNDGAVGNVGQVSAIRSNINAALAIPSLASINISNINYDEQSRVLSFNVNGTVSGDMGMIDPRITVYLTEDQLYSTQAGVNESQTAAISIPNYENNHVVRTALSGYWGDTVITDQTAGSQFSKTYTYTLPVSWRAHKVRVVAFINNMGSSVIERQVMNATKTGYLLDHTDPTTTTGISGVEASMNIKTYPNPATDMAYISAESMIHSFEVINTLGQQVMHMEGLNSNLLELNISDLAAGNYLVRVVTDNGVAAQRLSVVK